MSDSKNTGSGQGNRFARAIAGSLCVAALASAGSALAEHWTRSGGGDLYIRGIRLFANTPATGQATVYASTLGAGVLKLTHNGTGVTVAQINSGLPLLRIRTIAATDVNTLFAAVDSYGVYKSTNGGASWTAANGSGLTGLGCLTLRNISVRTATEIWALGACRHNSGIYRTLDGGATWTRLGAATIPDDAAVGSITFSGTGPATVALASTGRDGIFRSNDNGATWAQINNGIPAPAGANRISVFNVVVLANANQLVSWVEGQGVYRSADGGANWTPSGTGLPANTHSLAGISRESSTVLYLGADKGPVYRSTDGGLNWAPWGTTGSQESNSYVRGVTSDVTAAGRFWLHGLNGITFTGDNGATFNSVTLPDGYITGANLDPTGAGAYFAALNVYKIPDLYAPGFNGAVTIGDTLPAAADDILADTNTAGTLYAKLPNRGVYKSVNDGASWTPLTIPGREVGTTPAMEHTFADSQVLFAGLDNKFGTATGGGLLKSINGGGTWTDSSTGLANADARQINSIAVQDDPAIMLLGTDDGIYRSTNGGANWTLVHSVNDSFGTTLPFFGVRFDPVNPAIAWAAGLHVNPDGTVLSSSGVYKSTNGGATWTQVLSGRRVSQVRPESNGRIAALQQRDLSQSPVIASTDGGVTWQSLSAGIQENDGIAIIRTPRLPGTHLAIAMTTGGIYVLDKQALTVTVSGSGTVSSSPAGISCPGTCSANMYDHEPVTLTAAAGAGRVFAGWSGACTGTGTCQVSMDAARAVTATFIDPNPPRLANISTRGQVQTGFDVMIGGFVISGASAKTVVIRAIGPSLANFGVSGALANPTLQLVRSSDNSVIATNDDWGGATNASVIQSSGFAPSHPLESAIYVSLVPGAYTAIVSGVNNATGVGLVEVYEVDHPEVGLINISTRGKVQTGFDVMIGGFVVQGSGPQSVVIRAIGPSLANFGVSGALANPTLQLVRMSDGATIATNDDWGSASNAAQIQSSGFAPSNALESAILMSLPPGAYTAIVSGVNNGTGVGLIEVYTTQ
jgi:hypothetical protein